MPTLTIGVEPELGYWLFLAEPKSEGQQEIQSEIDALEDELRTTEERIGEIEAELGELEAEANGLRDEIGKREEEIDELPEIPFPNPPYGAPLNQAPIVRAIPYGAPLTEGWL